MPHKLLADGCQPDAVHKVCRSRGGESCSLDGAAIVLMPVSNAAHVVHGPISCAGTAWEGRGVLSTAGGLHSRGFTTDISELDVVYGGEEKLASTVREVVAAERPAAVFVYSTCVTGLIGEDLDAVCARLADELGLAVVPVHSPGFVGPKNLGNRIAGDALVEHVIGTCEPPYTTPSDLTLIGEYNVAGDLDLIEPLLAECGIRLLSRVTGNAGFEELRWAHRAKVSAVVCSRALINVAASLERRWGVPYVEVSFFGPTEIARSLRAIAGLIESVSPEAASAGLVARVEQVIGNRVSPLAEQVAPFLTTLADRRAVLYSGGVKSWSMVSCLRDLGIEVVAVGVKKSSIEDEEKLRLLAPDVPVLEDTSPAVIRRLMASGADLLVAGGRNRYLAAKEGWPFVDVNQERETAYAGYEGFVNLARELAHSVKFYERQGSADGVRANSTPTPVVRVEPRSGVIDPIKNAPTLGAALALQGVDRALPVHHGAQGCAFLQKVLGIRHFNEPIALATTKLFTEDVVLASEEAAIGAARKAVDGSGAAVVALISGALTEVKGDDVEMAARALADVAPAVIAVRAPDYQGSLEAGYLAAVRALVALAEETPGAGALHDVAPPAAPPVAPPAAPPVAPLAAPSVLDATAPTAARVTILAGLHLAPGDVNELRDIVESFGLTPVFVPDPSALDGSRPKHSALAEGGVTLAELQSLGASAHTLVLGGSLESAAHDLHARFGTPYTVFDGGVGLEATDELIATLAQLAQAPAPERLARQRRALVDAMRDSQLAFADARIALALEADQAAAVAALLDELAAPPAAAVVPVQTPVASRIPAAEVVIGDLASVPYDIDLLIASSHGKRTAEVRGATLLACGFPVWSYGASRRVSVGYRGAAALVDEIATLLTDHRHDPAHRPERLHERRSA